MDYEKKYEEALEKAREIVNNQNASSVWKEWLCNCFPELKDSEDEIRKEIISALKFANFKGVYDKHLAWLEKQGEQKPTDEEMKELLRTEYEKGRADVLNKIDSEQLDSFIELCNDLQMKSTNESLYDELEKLKNWIKSL